MGSNTNVDGWSVWPSFDKLRTNRIEDGGSETRFVLSLSKDGHGARHRA